MTSVDQMREHRVSPSIGSPKDERFQRVEWDGSAAERRRAFRGTHRGTSHTIVGASATTETGHGSEEPHLDQI
jgi:hypothetical protein